MKLILLIILFPVLCFSQTILNDNILHQLDSAETAMLNARWDEAYAIYDKIRSENPGNPTGYLFTAAAIQSEMIDREENIQDDRFVRMLDSTKVISERILENCSPYDSALCYLFLGHQYAYRAVWESRFGSSISAISYGMKAKNRYNDGLKADSSLIDLYLGLGSYHYWKTVKAGFLTFTGIFKNERKKGIEELILASDSALFSQNGARSALIWVWINEKEYDKALTMAGEMNDTYPGGNFFLWPMAESFYKSENYLMAIGVYETPPA